jgi:hypothetical protein
VGGSLKNADLTFDQHPFILRKVHHITIIIIEDIHKKNLHMVTCATNDSTLVEMLIPVLPSLVATKE